MNIKLLEIRDRNTLIGALCVDMQPSSDQERRHLRHYGFPCDGEPNILITATTGNGTPATNDYYFWGDRTWRTAHEYITTHWSILKTGDVVDVGYILGEKAWPASPDIGLSYAELCRRYPLDGDGENRND